MSEQTTTLKPVDEDTEPFLSGRFAPARDEIHAEHLPVSGTLPDDLLGHYLRNGPNPEFTPLGSYTYPMEGDGMIHGVWLEGGTARYANRYVRTQSLLAEERAGRAPLETVGRFDFGGGLPAGMCAHPKVDPVTGEMIVFRYDVQEPFLSWATIGADGSVSQPAVAVHGIDQGYMIHDFAITERYVVLTVGPVLFDLAAMFSGGQAIVWKPELGTRTALVPRDRTGPTRWVHHDAYWAWHYANAYDDGEVVQLDFAMTSAPAMLLADRSRITAGFTRATIDPGRETIALHQIDDHSLEFPRIDDRLVGLRHRYITVGGRSSNPAVKMGEHDQIHRYDMVTGTSTYLQADASVGEVSFAPRAGSTDELDGYYLAFCTDIATNRSSLRIWDAAAFPSDPVATVELPQRVPNGLHGNWFADD